MSAGNKRDYWEIRKRLAGKRLKVTHIHKALKEKEYVSYNTVLETVKGAANNRRTLEYLLELGIPAKLLDLPSDLKKEVCI